MNVVSFETAERLKKAGFPQPEILPFGALYYDNEKTLSVTCGYHFELEEDEFYAPTATELLADGFFMRKSDGVWWVYETEERITAMVELAAHTNPHEAAAQAWLYVNGK